MSVNVANAKGGEYATSRRGALTPYEVAFIHEQTRKGRSPQTIANMLGRAREDIIPVGGTAPAALPILQAVERPTAPPPPPFARDMIELVARRHGAFVDEVLGRTLRAPATLARQEAYFRLREMRSEDQSYRFSLPQIAAWFDRDHSTVLTGAASHQRRMEKQEADDLARWRNLGTLA